MKQEVHSYAYQLKQGCISTSIASHPRDPVFYASAICPGEETQSILYTLKYDEQIPQKSQLKSQIFPSEIKDIYTFKDESIPSIIINTHNSLVLAPYEQGENTPGLDNTVYKSEEKIEKLVRKNQKQGILCVGNRLLLVDIPTFEEKREIVKVENKKIDHCVVDPVYEYLTYTIGKDIFVMDKQCEKQKYGFKLATNNHQDIQKIEYNPNKQFYLMSTHPDCLKFWDIRKGNLPVKCIDDHHGLLLSCQYNHSHDELLITSYDDGTVGLYRINSVSTAPSGQNEDSLVKLYDQHQDSVYNIQWSGFSPWVFASISYGAANLVINTVPSTEKYRILL